MHYDSYSVNKMEKEFGDCSNNGKVSEFATSVGYRYQMESASLIVRKTSLPGCDFRGLFAGSFFPAGSVICKYTGEVLSTKCALRLADKSYLMRLGEQCYVDAKNNVNILARYINDCITPVAWNVKFDKRPAEKCAYVIALRDIYPGEELYVDYGRWYWVGKMPVKVQTD